jgi:hypothetical protein
MTRRDGIERMRRGMARAAKAWRCPAGHARCAAEILERVCWKCAADAGPKPPPIRTRVVVEGRGPGTVIRRRGKMVTVLLDERSVFTGIPFEAWVPSHQVRVVAE